MIRRLLFAFAVTLLSGICAFGEQTEIWDLSDLYASPEAWSAQYAKTKSAAEKLVEFKGTLGKSAQAMFNALSAISQVNKDTATLNVYASLKADEDLTIAPNQERQQQAQALATLVSEKTAWLNPEIILLGPKKIQNFLKVQPALAARFDFFLSDVLRASPHTLSYEAENLLAGASDLFAQPNTIRSQLAYSDLPFPKVTLSDGTQVQLDDAAYTKYRQANNRDDRKKIFDAFWGAYKAYENTFGATLTAQVKSDAYYAKAKKFNSSLAAATFQDNMPEAVYRTLIESTRAGLPVLHRYLKLRKRLLNISGDMGYEDIYPSMFPTLAAPQFSIEEAKKITLEALKPYGEPYLGFLAKGFSQKWMHAYPQPHKASGAYMNGSAYDVHPYLLLNYNNDYDALSTLAHEWGHAVHTLLAHDSQPYEKASYATFTAETASISNEMLLQDYMVAHAKNKQEKLFYLGEALEAIRGTFFRQAMFAEFQLAIHEEIEKGGTLSGPKITNMYCDLLKTYYGEPQGVIKIDPKYCVEWAFVSHFYFGFYVWQYATSMAGAAQLTHDILTQGDTARDRFIALLRSGGSDYPYNLYKKAGIDMATASPYQNLIARMSQILDEIEALLGAS